MKRLSEVPYTFGIRQLVEDWVGPALDPEALYCVSLDEDGRIRYVAKIVDIEELRA